MSAVWPSLHHVEERTLNVHIGRLRKRLNQNGQPDLIRTVRGVGYILESPARQAPDGLGDDRNVS